MNKSVLYHCKYNDGRYLKLSFSKEYDGIQLNEIYLTVKDEEEKTIILDVETARFVVDELQYQISQIELKKVSDE